MHGELLIIVFILPNDCINNKSKLLSQHLHQSEAAHIAVNWWACCSRWCSLSWLVGVGCTLKRIWYIGHAQLYISQDWLASKHPAVASFIKRFRLSPRSAYLHWMPAWREWLTQSARSAYSRWISDQSTWQTTDGKCRRKHPRNVEYIEVQYSIIYPNPIPQSSN
jgi:hypothetical protein